jgi:F-box/leucine-rich repeat protein 2/20
MNISNLPSQLIQYIVGFNNNTPRDIACARGVCTHWQSSLSDDALKASYGLETVIYDKRLSLSAIGLRTRTVYTVASDKLSKKIAHLCPELTHLYVCEVKITDATIIEFSQKCPKIIKLIVGGCSSLTDESIVAVARNCPNIKTISLDQCYKITDTSVIALANDCPNITELFMGGCSRLTDKSIVELAQNCPNITRLHLWGNYKITDTSIVQLAHNCPDITEIFLDFCNITDVSVLALTKTCPNIISLGIGKCEKITDASILEVVRKYPGLQNLYMRETKLTDVSIIAIAQGCPGLKNIFMTDCEHITIGSIRELQKLCRAVTVNM